jgi:ABC-2 type transport system ATP-binding protein
MIVADELRKGFGRHEAIDGLSFRVPEGSAFALIGANGAGKTTTLKILMNILQPSGGHATVLGTDSKRLSAKEFRRIGYVSENQQMPLALTIGEYLDYLRPFYQPGIGPWNCPCFESLACPQIAGSEPSPTACV